MVAKVAFDKKFPQFSLDKLEHKNGEVTLETSIGDLMPGLNIELKGTKKSEKLTGDLSATYKIPQLTFTSELDVVNLSSLKKSICFGSGPMTLGADGSFSKGALSDFSLGVGYTIPKQAFLGIRADNKITDFSANFLYTVNKDVTVGGNVTYPKTGFALGATYKCNPKTALKFKMSTNGNCAASAKQTIDSSTSICAAAAFDIKKPSEYKFGVIASLG